MPCGKWLPRCAGISAMRNAGMSAPCTRPENIEISGHVASVAAVSGYPAGSGAFVSASPGMLLAGAEEVTIEPDTDHVLTVRMQRQVRELVLFIKPAGSSTDRIESVEGYMSGAAGTLDFAAGIYGAASNVPVQFTKITEGEDSGIWTAAIGLLGVVGDSQKLYLTITYTDGNPADTGLEYDITEDLRGFNEDKSEPLVLDCIPVDTPVEAVTGIRATAVGATWADGEFVGLATDDDAAVYELSNGSLVPADPYNPLRWPSKTSPVSVVGWYVYGMSEEYAGSRPEIFTVQTDQSTEEGAKGSDFMYASGTISYNGANVLTFSHSLTKLRVNVTYKDGAEGVFDWKYPFLIDGKIAADGSVTADENGTASPVVPSIRSTPYGSCDETFEFMLPVQFVKGGELLATFSPNAGGGPAELKLPASGIQLKVGVAMAIDIVVSPLSISINGNISWGEGGSGSGSVVLP